jgi:hypothetical protein
MNTTRCFENRTFHIYTEHNKNSKCSNESSDYTQKVKFGAIMNENCKKVNAATNGLSSDVVARTFGRSFPNYQLRNDLFDVSCNKIKNISENA